MFHRPRTEETTNTQTVEKPVAAEAVKTPAEPVRNEAPARTVQQTEAKTEEKQMNKEDQDSKPQQPQAASRPLDIPGQMKPFQPQGQAPRMPGSYAYPGAPATGMYGSAASSSSTASQGRRLIIGEGITMSGEIESCDYLLVEGTVEAALKGASVLEIAEAGVFYGTVEISEATISGRFEGDITCNGRLTVTATGSVTGTIAYKELAVEAGATVDGKMVPLNAKAAPKKNDKPKSRGVSRDEGSELPFSGSAAA
jgi:cytoskeletal protein CcmA (bactofilin family)